MKLVDILLNNVSSTDMRKVAARTGSSTSQNLFLCNDSYIHFPQKLAVGSANIAPWLPNSSCFYVQFAQ